MILLLFGYSGPSHLMVIPFVLLLLLIATGPLFFADFWHHHYKKVSIGLGLLVGAYYIFGLKDFVLPVETLAEYISFISLLTILYIASGGIYLFIDVESKAKANILFLFIAALVTNVIGTTGASVLLIRPYMRLNRYRLKAYHIVFFIFIVSNVGGSLTPVGDPPLFMGFLKGVPFYWTMEKMILPWLTAVGSLLLIFYFFERKNSSLDEVDSNVHYTNRVIIHGKRNLFWLLIAITSIFIDPNVIDGLPYFDFHGKKISFLREAIQLISSALCFYFANPKALDSNEFDFEPIKEVAYLFIGIFLCMMPALQMLEQMAGALKGSFDLSKGVIYWTSGIFSSFLDNAPTYLNIFTLIMSDAGLNPNSIEDVHTFLAGPAVNVLVALSSGAVFFGAMTYIGNGPNFMVKSIAEQTGVKMPGFGKYMFSYSIPVLLPVLVFVWLLFFI